MKTKTKRSNITVPVVLAVALILVLSLTFALFTETVEGRRQFTLSNFTSAADVYFMKNGTRIDPANDEKGSVGGATYYDVSLDSEADNYIGNLRVDVQYNGQGVGLLRVHVAEELSSTTGTVRSVRPYTIAIPYFIGDSSNNGANNNKLYADSDSGNKAKWYDNRTGDYCYYYATPIRGSSTISLITGLDENAIDFAAFDKNSDEMRVIIEADVVQVNRYPQYWGRNTLPWSTADTASAHASSATENAS